MLTRALANCNACGGILIHDYLSGTCKCENCGESYTITDLYPDYAKYNNVITSITKANRNQYPAAEKTNKDIHTRNIVATITAHR